MKKNKIKIYLDYIPFVILCISAVILIWTISTTDAVFVWKHYVGFILIVITGFIFFIRHQFGVLALGLTLIIGLIGFISFSPAITTIAFGLGDANILRFQPIFLLWIIIHIILSGRYYVGIASKKYWQKTSVKSRL